MLWPEAPLCHEALSPVFKYGPAVWQAREDSGERHCSYCGSLHPEALLKHAFAGTLTMHGTDWKYGWPHKFYVTIPNPKAAGATQQLKFYSEHLQDLTDPATFDAVRNVVRAKTLIMFVLRDDGKGLGYSAPRPGYQA